MALLVVRSVSRQLPIFRDNENLPFDWRVCGTVIVVLGRLLQLSGVPFDHTAQKDLVTGQRNTSSF